MRNFVYVAAAVVALSLTACGKEETAATEQEMNVAPVETMVEQAAPAADMSATEVAPEVEQTATPEGSVAAE